MPKLAAEIASREIAAVDPLMPAATAEDIVEASRYQPFKTDDPMRIASMTTGLLGNPEHLDHVISRVGHDFDEYAPGVAEEARSTLMRAMMFLSSKAPKSTLLAPGLDPLPPPETELRKYQRYISAVSDPASVLADAADGTVSREGIEALREVYPEMFGLVRGEIASRLTDNRAMPYQKRLQLSVLLGQDMAGTLKPQLASTAQATYREAAQAPAPASQQRPMKRFQAEALQGTADRAGRETAAWREAQMGARVGSGTR